MEIDAVLEIHHLPHPALFVNQCGLYGRMTVRLPAPPSGRKTVRMMSNAVGSIIRIRGGVEGAKGWTKFQGACGEVRGVFVIGSDL